MMRAQPIDPDDIDNAYDPHARQQGEDLRLNEQYDDQYADDPYGDNHYHDDQRMMDLPPNQRYDPAYDPRFRAHYNKPLVRKDPRYESPYNNSDKLPEQEQQHRDHKYSTARMPSRGRWRKCCCILLLFLLGMAFTAFISWLINYLFFDPSDNGPANGFPDRPENSTFPANKLLIDQVCSRGTFDIDDGMRCEEACEPQFFTCCDPFNEFRAYNYSRWNNVTNSTLPPDVNFMDGLLMVNGTECSFENDLRGCMSYAKCQALGQLADPAPSTLPILCSAQQLEKDRVSCEQACLPVRCCFSQERNCLADNFDVCMDYAPCQNLREGFTVETAPDDLDQACWWELSSCFETCEKASCCGDPESTCFQDNFLSCLTYAPCTNVTETNITVPEMYNVVGMPPAELIYACNAKHEATIEETNKTCAEYCVEAECCYATDKSQNCFADDPLGCLAWNAQCQVLFYDDSSKGRDPSVGP